jgi:hypothetical protein
MTTSRVEEVTIILPEESTPLWVTGAFATAAAFQTAYVLMLVFGALHSIDAGIQTRSYLICLLATLSFALVSILRAWRQTR